MRLRGILNYLVLFVELILATGCTSIPEPSQSVEDKANNNPGIVLVDITQKIEKESLEFYCYQTENCYKPITLERGVETLPIAEFEASGELLIPIRTRFQDETNRAGFIILTKKTQKIVMAPVVDLNWYSEISQVIFSDTQMIFTIDGKQHVYVLTESGQIKDIPLNNIESNSFLWLRKGTHKDIVVVGTNIKKQANGNFIDLKDVDLLTYTVKTEVIPGPESSILTFATNPVSGLSYNVQVNGITEDRRIIYYQYFGLDDHMQMANQLGLYDTQIKHDKNHELVECMGQSPFKEYKGFLYRNGRAIDGMPSEKFFIVQIFDLQSIFNSYQTKTYPTALRVVPFGDSFLLGSDKQITQIDFSGKPLQEFPVPSQFINQDYIVAKFEN